MTDLDKLIEAVEAGSVTNEHLPDSLVAVWQPIVGALNGSLDAALRLHEALLPGVAAVVQTNGSVQTIAGAPGWERHTAVCENQPARAWLLAILKALAAHEQGEGEG